MISCFDVKFHVLDLTGQVGHGEEFSTETNAIGRKREEEDTRPPAETWQEDLK